MLSTTARRKSSRPCARRSDRAPEAVSGGERRAGSVSSMRLPSAPRKKCCARWSAPAPRRHPDPAGSATTCIPLRRSTRSSAERSLSQTFIEILRRALDEELARDPAVHLLGEDVAAGGAFGVTRGLAQKHGEKRVRNTPISEAAITGHGDGRGALRAAPGARRSCSSTSPRCRSTRW